MKYIPTKILFALLFLSNITISMDIMQTIKEPSIPTKLAIEAINSDSPESLKLALSIGADIRYVSELVTNLLLYATETKKEKTALYLSTQEHFQQNSIINQQNCNGNTTVICAARYGYKEVVKNLLKIESINLDLQNSDGASALHYATAERHDDIITLLIEHGANATLQNNHGATVACWKSILNNPKLDQSIIKKIIHARDMYGNNQLHLLTTADIGEMAKITKKTIDVLFIEILESLIQLGVNIWNMNNYHMLPVETAYKGYNQLHQQYVATKKHCFQHLLNAQEKMLHLLLLYYVKQTLGKPMVISSPFTRELNVETAIAQKYKDNESYYTAYAIDFKDKLKKQLYSLPNLTQTWITMLPVNSYIPPQLINDTSSQTNNQYRKEKIS